MVNVYELDLDEVQDLTPDMIKDVDCLLVHTPQNNYDIKWYKSHTINLQVDRQDKYCCNIGDFSKNNVTLREFQEYCESGEHYKEIKGVMDEEIGIIQHYIKKHGIKKLLNY